MNSTSPSRERIIEVIYESVDEVNAQLGLEQRVRKAPETSMVIGEGGLDSLGYINLITAIEEKCEERFGQFVSLFEAEGETASYATIGELADFIQARVTPGA